MWPKPAASLIKNDNNLSRMASASVANRRGTSIAIALLAQTRKGRTQYNANNVEFTLEKPQKEIPQPLQKAMEKKPCHLPTQRKI